MTRRGLRYSRVRLGLQRRIPRGTSWLFHWAATDGDAVPKDLTHRRLLPGDEVIGVSITTYYRDRILAETGITERWWNAAVAKWVAAGVACRCEGYKSVFLFIFDDSACRRCGMKAGTESSHDRELRVPNLGTESSRSERDLQTAINGMQKQSAPVGLGVPAVQGSKAIQKSRRAERKRLLTADEAWVDQGGEDDAANL
jgi:hypothetical protein